MKSKRITSIIVILMMLAALPLTILADIGDEIGGGSGGGSVGGGGVRLSYEVHYYYGETEDETLRVTQSVDAQAPGVSESDIEQQQKPGYKLADIPYDPPLPATVTSLDDDIFTIKVNYVIDEEAKLDYEVHYYYDDTEDETLRTTQSVHVLDPFVKESAIKQQQKLGYKLKDEPYDPLLPATVTSLDDETFTIKVYYVIDEGARLNYDVRYFYDETEDETLRTTQSVHVLDPFVRESDIKQQQKPGYEPADVPYNPQLPATVTSLDDEPCVISVYYTARTDLSYTVEYREGSAAGEKLKQDKAVDNRTFGQKYEEEAAAIDGYIADESKKEITIAASDNKIVFIYTARTDLSYTVEYRKGTASGEKLKADKIVDNVIFGQKYEEEAAAIDGYIADESKKEITIAVSDNKIVFIYDRDEDVVLYEVRYYYNGTEDETLRIIQSAHVLEPYVRESDIKQQQKPGYEPADVPYEPELPATVTSLDDEPCVISVYYTARTDLSYTVEYREGSANGEKLKQDKAVDNRTFGQKYNEEAATIEGYVVDESTKEITIAVSDNKIVFIYTARTDLSYTVEYRKETESGEKLKADKIVDNVTFGQKYEEEAAVIDGYVADESKKEITIAISDNKIVFIYTLRTDLRYTVEYRKSSVTGEKLKEDKVVDNVTFGQKYEEEAAAITGYKADSGKKEITIGISDNKIVFIYTATTNEPVTGAGGVGGGGGNDEQVKEDAEPEEPEPLTTDAPEETPPLDFLETNEHRVYLQGYPENIVKPDHSITRAEMATIFYRLLKDAYQQIDAAPTFSDVPGDSWYSKAVATLAELGIIMGYEDGTFQPNKPITRAEFAVVAARFAKLSTTRSIAFSDVPADHWAAKDIASAFARGWINGYSDGTYLPNKLITRAEVTKIINIMLKRLPTELPESFQNPFTDISAAHWAFVHIMEAATHHEYGRDNEGTEFWTTYTRPGSGTDSDFLNLQIIIQNHFPAAS